MISLCNDWEFTEQWSEAFLRGEGKAVPVRLPHTVRETPLHYATPGDYEMVCGYRRRLPIPGAYQGKRLFLQFDGAAHIARVYVNGKECAQHRCGYTAFRVEITDLVDYGADNRLAVQLECTENPEIPPFCFVIDYLTYGGLYREVWLDVRGQSYLEDVFVTTPGLDRLEASVTVQGEAHSVRLRVWNDKKLLASETGKDSFSFRVPETLAWTPELPRLYRCTAELLDEDGTVLDTWERKIGFRTAWFQADGFYLNGKRPSCGA